MGRLNEILRKADPLVGVGPQGIHSEYLKVLVTDALFALSWRRPLSSSLSPTALTSARTCRLSCAAASEPGASPRSARRPWCQGMCRACDP
jgi:hypothetical protein